MGAQQRGHRGPDFQDCQAHARALGRARPDRFALARGVADAVLYEGYLLYPYRRSSGKNRVRWQFGVLVPRRWLTEAGAADTSVTGSADAWRQQTECLLRAPEHATIHVRLRFLQLQHRSVEIPAPDGNFRVVDVLDFDGQRHLTFDEAVPQEFDVSAHVGALLDHPQALEVTAPGGEVVDLLGGGDAGRIVRRRWPVSATVRLSLEPLRTADAPCLLRLRLVTENTGTSVSPGAPRSEALRGALVATHSLLGVEGGSFLSLLDPPAGAAAAARECHNVHTYPVLAGDHAKDHGEHDVMLSSPILMYDYPQVSPESPGNLFDATEIDEILSLRTLTLTDEEKREARATDPRAAEIVDRVDAMPPEVLERLHGAVRSLRPVDAEADSSYEARRGFEPFEPTLKTRTEDRI